MSAANAAPNSVGFMPFGRVEVGTVTFLSTITLGIYFLIWLYKGMTIYRTMSRRSGANLEQLFWGTIIALGATFVLSLATIVLGLLAAIAAVVISAILINEVLKDRDEIGRRYGVLEQLPSAGTLIAVWVISEVLSLTLCGLIVGIPLAVWFYYQFFLGHNIIIDASQAAGERQGSGSSQI